MKRIPQSYQWPLALAIVLHVLLGIALAIHFFGSHYRLPGPVSKDAQHIVQATAISHQQLTQQMQQIREEKMQKILAEKHRIERIEAQKLAIKRAKLLAIKKRQQAKQKHIKQAQLKKLLAKQQQLQHQLMQQQLQHDQQRLSQAKHAAQMQGVVDQYRAMILQKLHGYWHVPADIDQNLHCTYRVELAPNGVVLSATLMKSSGNPALDRLAKITIMRASPLPVPTDPAIFDNMRELQLIMTPGTQRFGWG